MAQVGRLCGAMAQGAIEAAIDGALAATIDNFETYDSSAEESDDDIPVQEPLREGGADVLVLGQAEEEDAEPRSPSLMSIVGPLPSSPWKEGDAGSPRPDSPSLIVLDAGPIWTSHKPLKRGPQTPPRSARVHKSERPLMLGVPQPLSARGRERCTSSEPLSARYRRPSGYVPAVARSPSHFGGA